MRVPWGILLLGAAVGGARAQDAAPSSMSRPPSSSASSMDSFVSSAPPTSAGSSSADSSRGDTTVTSTVTVRSNDASTVTSTNTVTSTVTVRTTLFSTTVITGNQETATSTVFETSTVIVEEKRSLGRDWVRDARVPQAVEAVPTAPSTGGKAVKGDGKGRATGLQRRAVTTVTVTVTQGGGEPVTSVVNKVINTALTLPITSVITQTSQVNARTTVTVTSTITVSSTSVAPTVEETPTAAASSGQRRQQRQRRQRRQRRRTVDGRKGWHWRRCRRRRPGLVWRRRLAAARALAGGPQPEHDGFMGSSEVPVARPGDGNAARPPMSQSQPTSTGSYLSPGHSHQTPAEGYRGTAMGDGRAGYAQPGAASYGSSVYTPSRNTTVTQPGANNGRSAGPDQLPRHPTPGDSSIVSPTSATPVELNNDSAAATAWFRPGASEIDGHAVAAGQPGQSGSVYEMPTQSYR